MKLAIERPYADPEEAARRILEIAHTIETAQSKIYIELINYPMLFKDNASPAEYWEGLQRAVANGWLVLHESGTFVTFTPAGAEMFP